VSRKARVRLVVGAVALAAAGIAVAGGLFLDGEEPAARETRPLQEPAAREPPPLELGPFDAESPQARDLAAAERAYEQGRIAEARRRFEAVLGSDPSSVEAAVGAAIASWPDATVERLRELAVEHPNSALVRLHLGLALYAQRDMDEAESEWRQAEEREPDSPAALRAEDLLHPNMAPGRPLFVARETSRPALPADLTVAEQLAELKRRAQSGDAEDLLAYGAALQRVGRPISARAAFEDAVASDPKSLDAQVAAAVARFDKDAPEEAFSRLGALTRDHPRAGVVRYHLTLLLLWIRAVDEARRQLELTAESKGLYAREARRLLARLEEI
jgi:tetratricopeptide (TPR) repeat protein